MSFQSWCKEFYPVPAERVSKRQALAHSIRKWTGLLRSNLRKHGIGPTGWWSAFDTIGADDGELLVNSDSCALCIHHHLNNNPPCRRCPLALVRDGVPCDTRRDDEDDPPYSRFLDTGDARPMLRWLRAAARAESKTRRRAK